MRCHLNGSEDKRKSKGNGMETGWERRDPFPFVKGMVLEARKKCFVCQCRSANASQHTVNSSFLFGRETSEENPIKTWERFAIPEMSREKLIHDALRFWSMTIGRGIKTFYPSSCLSAGDRYSDVVGQNHEQSISMTIPVLCFVRECLCTYRLCSWWYFRL